MSAFFTGEFGFDIYNTTKRQLDFMSFGGTSTNRGVAVLEAWSESNRGAEIPALSVVDNNNEMRMSTYYVEDGSYVKMKYLKLQYNLPKSILKEKLMRKMYHSMHRLRMFSQQLVTAV